MKNRIKKDLRVPENERSKKIGPQKCVDLGEVHFWGTFPPKKLGNLPEKGVRAHAGSSLGKGTPPKLKKSLKSGHKKKKKIIFLKF